MSEEPIQRVTVSRHAAQQAYQRAALSVDEVVREVHAALDAGRVSRERPGFLGAGGDASRGWFAWDSGERFGVVIVPSGRSGERWTVVTLIAAAAPSTTLAQAFAAARSVTA